jgi:Carboxypeptidase regulatory-like domain
MKPHFYIPGLAVTGALIAAITAFSCSSPTAPANVPSSQLQSEIDRAAALVVTLKGRIADADTNAPVSGANVNIANTVAAKTIAAAMTHDGGLYTSAFAPQPAVVRVEKPGYEPSAQGPPLGSPNPTLNFVVYRIVRIPAGSSGPVTVVLGNLGCEYQFDVYPCRTVHVVAPHNGTLTLELVADLGSTGGPFLQVVGANVSYGDTRLETASVAVSAGQDVTVQILVWPGPASATLNTSLE